MSGRFLARKQKILEQLDAPDGEYHDLSPKGSVDLPIRALIRDINQLDGLVTTSSCSGRISVFLEGRRADASNPELEETTVAGPGGKGGGGSWLFISHDAISVPSEDDPHYFLSKFNLRKSDPTDEKPNASSRYIHLKFEPMILHILTASLENAQRVLTAALGSGFRESGAVSLNPAKSGEIDPMVAVRSTGYSFDAIIGYHSDQGRNIALVDEAYLHILVDIANERFKINAERILRFQTSLVQQYNIQAPSSADSNKSGWEDTETRKRRKREEGLARQRAMKERINSTGKTDADS
ncbi:hypothetical protein P280DRAFT_437795 [Massarina eburnea CBS 473.64]|uniref:tRNA(Phe) 7-[(3-amino-3-carboxypropyl)-4-demethylwyosine(37)-N(4)]-methyltransferase n=1 Tax=Massarina eburnea CBS 473.64 TaxID=1395130 RepID=A0A6A6RLW0_9PLEO|nr:hypothetical protein P280DRAFT_437795 [Massarina eburnea CBS 473.64]